MERRQSKDIDFTDREILVHLKGGVDFILQTTLSDFQKAFYLASSGRDMIEVSGSDRRWFINPGQITYAENIDTVVGEKGLKPVNSR